MSREHFEQVLKEKFDNLIDYRVCSNGDGEYMAWDMQVAWFSWQAATSAMEAKCAALAAELQSVKTMNDCLSEELRGYESDGEFEGPKMHLLWWKAETPATDAFLAEVRAQGVEMFGQYHNFSEKLFIQKEAKKFAAQLRQGGAE